MSGEETQGHQSDQPQHQALYGGGAFAADDHRHDGAPVTFAARQVRDPASADTLAGGWGPTVPLNEEAELHTAYTKLGVATPEPPYVEDEEEDGEPYYEKRPKSLKVKLVFGVAGAIVLFLICTIIYGVFFKHHGKKPEPLPPVASVTEEVRRPPANFVQDPLTQATQPQSEPAPDAQGPEVQLPSLPAAQGPAAGATARQEPPSAGTAGAVAPAAEPERQTASEARAIGDLTAQIRDLRATLAVEVREREQLANDVAALKAGSKPPVTTTRAVTAPVVTPVEPKTAPKPVKDHTVDAPTKHPASKVKPVAPTPLYEPATTAADSAKCTLMGATNGIFGGDKRAAAWISTDGRTPGPDLHVGDRAPCIGLIQSIDLVGTDWVVAGAAGKLKLSAGGRN